MHSKWEDMIPFYVAQTLSQQDAIALEAHLADCEPCRQQVEEWREIATAIWATATKEIRELPPLSQRVRHEVQRDTREMNRVPIAASANGAHSKVIPLQMRPQSRKRQPSITVPITMVAAVAMILLIGGAILYMVLAPSTDDDATNIAALSGQGTETPVSTPSRSSDEDMGILMSPVPSATLIPFSSPTQRAMPPSGLGGVGGGDPDVSMIAPEGDALNMAGQTTIQTQDPTLCFVINDTGQNINIYRLPGIQYEVADTLTIGERIEANVRSENGWYQVIVRGEGLIGWVDGALVTATDACNDVPLPTPTRMVSPTSALTSCLAQGITDDGAVNIYAGPGQTFDILNAMSPQTGADVVAQSDNGWYQVEYTIYGLVWNGWVRSAAVTLYRQCEGLPMVRSQGYTPFLPPMTMTPTPVGNVPTQVATQGEVVHFTAILDTTEDSQQITVRWQTRNVTNVWIDYHSANVDPSDAGFQPDGVFNDLSPTGRLSILIPEDYPHDEIRLNLILDRYDTMGRQAGDSITVVIE